MAYNPFNIFRRNQKAIFAVVTVVIMFVFVLSSGLTGSADFFNWLPEWFGKKNQKGNVVCKLDGDKIYETQLRDLAIQRNLANRFMMEANSAVLRALQEYASQQFNQITDPQSRKIFQQAGQAAQMLNNPNVQMLRSNPQFASMIRQWEEQLAAPAELARSPNAKPAEKEFIRAQQYLEILARREQSPRGERADLFFLNAPNRTNADRVNFLIWQKKADQLGISFREDDIKRMVADEFYNFFRDEAQVQVRQTLQRQSNNRFNFDACIAAIGEEFRVRTAQLAVLGPGMVNLRPDQTFSGTPVFTTPFEQFEYYRDKCSPTAYEVIPVPAIGFMDKVVGEPAPKELDRLFDQYKNAEPNPARETPGFKIPREIKLGWISATGEEPYYQKMAEQSLKLGELQAKLGSLMTIPLPGSGPGWVAEAVGPMSSMDLLLELNSVQMDYEVSIKDQHDARMKSNWGMPSFVPEGTKETILDTSIVRPATLVAGLGGAVGGSLTLAGPFSGVGTFESAVRSFELRDRILAGAPPVFGAVPGPSLLATAIGGEAAMRSLLPKPLPIEAAKPELMKHLTESTARQLMLNDLKTFTTEVAKLAHAEGEKDGKSAEAVVKDKGPLLKYISEFVAARGLKSGSSEKLRSEWTLEEDPGLAPLQESLTKLESLNKGPHGNAPIQFGRKFFWKDSGGPPQPASSLFRPEYYPKEPSSHESPAAKAEPTFLVWRTEETASRVPAAFTDREREQVRNAWKLMQARDLARNRAEAIASAVRVSPSDNPELIVQNLRELANKLNDEMTNPKAKAMVHIFDIENVCPLSGSEFQRPPHEFFIPPSKDIPYPTKEMRQTLLDERTKPPKTTFVLADGPKNVYYVVTLKTRQEKTERDFQMIYSDFSIGGMNMFTEARQIVLGSYLMEQGQAARQSVMGLMKQEFKFEATEEQKKKLEENDQGSGEM